MFQRENIRLNQAEAAADLFQAIQRVLAYSGELNLREPVKRAFFLSFLFPWLLRSLLSDFEISLFNIQKSSFLRGDLTFNNICASSLLSFEFEAVCRSRGICDARDQRDWSLMLIEQWSVF